MQRAALRFGAFLSALTACARVFAHGAPPDAYAILSRDAQGVKAVSFNSGLALRRASNRYQYVCPETWGDQFPAPVAALADGTLVIGAVHGLQLLAEDGSVRAHPDPAAVGRSTDVVRSKLGVFSLRAASAGSEVLAVDADKVRVLWKDANSMWSMAALDDKLVLLRADGMALEQVTISATDGTELERQTGTLDQPVDNVVARTNAGTAYAVLVYRSVMVGLGVLRMNVFSKLAAGETSIAGPLTLANSTVIAVDGQLAQLVDGQATPLADSHKVVGLAEHDGLSYACDQDGIAPLSGQSLGEPLFRFIWLAPPNYQQVMEGDMRMYCSQQWSDTRVDVMLGGMTLLVDMPDAGTAPAVAAIAGAGGAAAQSPAAAGAGGGILDAGVPAVVPGQPSRERGHGCTIAPRKRETLTAHVFALGLGLGVARLRRRRKTRRLLTIRTAGEQ